MSPSGQLLVALRDVARYCRFFRPHQHPGVYHPARAPGPALAVEGKAATMTSGMPLLSANRLLLAASLCLLALAGERLLSRGADAGAGDGFATGYAACSATHRSLVFARLSCAAATASATTTSADANTEVQWIHQSGRLTTAANGTVLPPGPAGRLDGDHVLGVLRAVIEAHAVGTLLHYPCGNMSWAGPVIAALQVRSGLISDTVHVEEKKSHGSEVLQPPLCADARK